MYCENFSASNPDVAAARYSDVPWPPPVGCARNQCYRFAVVPTAADLRAYRRDAIDAADEKLSELLGAAGSVRRVAIGEGFVVYGDTEVPPRVEVPVAHGVPGDPPVEKWRLAATVGSYVYGVEVDHLPSAGRCGDRDLHEGPGRHRHPERVQKLFGEIN